MAVGGGGVVLGVGVGVVVGVMERLVWHRDVDG